MKETLQLLPKKNYKHTYEQLYNNKLDKNFKILET